MLVGEAECLRRTGDIEQQRLGHDYEKDVDHAVTLMSETDPYWSVYDATD